MFAYYIIIVMEYSIELYIMTHNSMEYTVLSIVYPKRQGRNHLMLLSDTLTKHLDTYPPFT